MLMQVNLKKTEVLKDGTFETLTWEDVVAGDILKVNSDEEFPADMVFLCSSDSQGVYISCSPRILRNIYTLPSSVESACWI